MVCPFVLCRKGISGRKKGRKEKEALEHGDNTENDGSHTADPGPRGIGSSQCKGHLQEADRRIQTEDIREIIFDFADTTFCDSSGIGMLMGRYKMIRALGGKVRAVQVQAQVARILTLSGVTKIIPVEEVEGGRSK